LRKVAFHSGHDITSGRTVTADAVTMVYGAERSASKGVIASGRPLQRACARYDAVAARARGHDDDDDDDGRRRSSSVA
jgi:hypothetical protein